MDGISDKRERIKEAIRQSLNFLFFPFPMGDALFEFAKHIRNKILVKD
jgi:hypothetical protein